MKSALLLILFTVFSIDVSGADVKVSVMVGDSVTLHNADKKVQTEDVIKWDLNGKCIAVISEGSNTFPECDEELKARLQPQSKTGDLQIRNIKTKDSGDYKLEITTIKGSSEKTFSVSVVPADVSANAVKSVIVMEGDSVTLKTDIQTYGVIQWRFGHQKSLVAEFNQTAENTSDGPDGRFRDRLQQGNQSGSLTINNITSNHSGLYEAEISNTTSGYTIHHTQSFNVTVSDGVREMSVEERNPVTLQIGTEIQKEDLVLWIFGDTQLAKINKADQHFPTSVTHDERFRDRLKLDHQTGSLTITDTRTTDSGDYELKISSSRRTINRRISVTVTDVVESLSVMVGDSVTLHTNFTIIRNKHTVSWFNDQGIVITGLTSDATGDLTIRNIQSDQSGEYEVNIIMRSSMVFQRIFCVNISGEFSNEKDGMKTLSVTNGESILLYTHVTEIQNIPVEWIFVPQNISIVKTDGKSNTPLYSNNERFKNILDLNNQTGDLSINNSNTDHSGVYQLKIINRAYTIQKSFNVTVKQLAVSVPDQSSSDVTGIVVGVILLVVAVVAVGLIYIKKRKQERHRENGQNHRTQDTVDTVNEETILNNDS